VSLANHPRRTHLHVAWSCLLIFTWLTFAGCVAPWIFGGEPQSRVMALGMTLFPVLLALLQYLSTFRYHREATILSLWLCGVLSVATFLYFMLPLSTAVSDFIHGPMQLPIPLVGGLLILVPTLIANTYHQLVWSHHLMLAHLSQALPAVPKAITLREIFLLTLAIGWVLGIASHGLRQGWQNFLF